ncbi:HNH endonuclease [Bacillus thuringiensis]|uniref:HNH endonuclease n=1 Tax=Bacillus thuringiensis TaxID=1428 RepID=UPI000BFE017C|nr:HNH endonuclease [Bacillus thuringiensis]PGT90147.1 hypothetical protein COD17_10390 [Bacillus thuringiensis]
MSEKYEGLQDSLNRLGELMNEEEKDGGQNPADNQEQTMGSGHNEDTPIHEMADAIFGHTEAEETGTSVVTPIGGVDIQDSFGDTYEGEDIFGEHDAEKGEANLDAVTDFGNDMGDVIDFGEDMGADLDIPTDFGEDTGTLMDFGETVDDSIGITENTETVGTTGADMGIPADFGVDIFAQEEQVSPVTLEKEEPMQDVTEPLVTEQEDQQKTNQEIGLVDEDNVGHVVQEEVVVEIEEAKKEPISLEKAPAPSQPESMTKDGVTYHTATGSVREDVKVVTEELIQEEKTKKEELQDRIERAKEKKEQLLGNPDIQVNLDYVLEDSDGNQIEARNYEGGYLLDVVPIDKIKGVGSSEDIIRKADLELANLQEDIHRVGLLEPLHVVPHRQVGYRQDNEGEDNLSRPVFHRYLLLSGRRRLEACIALGYTEIPVLVDSTIPPQLIKFYEAMTNNMKEYSFPEKLQHANFLKRTQSNITNDMVENILNWRSGEYLKAQYIDQMKNDYPDIYRQVDTNKLNIEQGFKKLEKEIEKAQKELEQGEVSEDDIDEKLREENKDELTELQVDKQQQTVGDRKPLDRMVRKSIEIRDLHCQCCGFGKGEEDFMGVFQVHHMIPVQYGGSDDKYNLILLCSNCHKLVHDYERGEFIPAQVTFDKYDSVKRIVVLGNMLKRMRGLAFEWLRKNRDDLWNLVNKGATSVGKALVTAGADLKGETFFEPTPYEKFKQATSDLDLGIAMDDELGVIEWTAEDEKQNEEIMSYGKM